jgi:hypothetical protein
VGEMKRHINEILDFLENTSITEIDSADNQRLAELQDLLNVTHEEAKAVARELKGNLEKLFCIVIDVCGFRAFEFWTRWACLDQDQDQDQREVRTMTTYLELFETAHGNRVWRFVDEPRQYQPLAADGRVLRTVGPIEAEDMEADEYLARLVASGEGVDLDDPDSW